MEETEELEEEPPQEMMAYPFHKVPKPAKPQFHRPTQTEQPATVDYSAYLSDEEYESGGSGDEESVEEQGQEEQVQQAYQIGRASCRERVLDGV